MTTEPTINTKPINQLVSDALALCEQFHSRSDQERMQPLSEAKRILFTRIPAEPGFAEFKQKNSEFYSTYRSLCEYQQKQELAILEERFEKLRPTKPATPPERNSSMGARSRGPRPFPGSTGSKLPYPTSPSDSKASPRGSRTSLPPGYASSTPSSSTVSISSQTESNGGVSNGSAQNGPQNEYRNGTPNGTLNGSQTNQKGAYESLRANGQQNGYPGDSPRTINMPEPRRSVSPIKRARAEDYEISPAILRNKIRVSSVLVLDVRQRSAFEKQHIDAPLIACLDPTYLTSRMSVSNLDDTFALAPTDDDAENFAYRDSVDMIVLYDARSQHISQSPILQSVTNAFVEAGKRPYLLRGGIDAWVLSGNSVIFSNSQPEASQPTNATPPPPSKPPPPVPPPHHLFKLQDTQHTSAQRELPSITRMPTLPPAVPSLQSRVLTSPPPPPKVPYSAPPMPSSSGNTAVPPDQEYKAVEPSSKSFVHTPEDLARTLDGYADELPRTGLKSLRVPKMHANPNRDLSVSPAVSPVRQLAQLSRTGSKSSHKMPSPSLSAVAPRPGPSYPPGILKTTGLKNLGNSCYMNCVIQCMLSVPSFVLPFYDGSFAQYINYRSRLGYQGALATEFAGLVRAMLEPNTRFIAPIGMKRLAGRLRPDDFGGYEQQDCQEFLTFVLDGLHEDLNSNGDKARDGELDPQEEKRREHMGIRAASAIEWERYLKGDTSLIVDLFQGQYLSRLQCTVCRNTSTTYNAFSSLSLPLVSPKLLEHHTTLRACFDEFVKPEMLDGDNAWHCPYCERKQRAIKTLRISRLPPILIIHLKRFKRSLTGAVNKLETPVDYPLRGLDLTRYWPQLTQGEHSKHEAELLASLPPRGQTPPFLYDLRAVTLHHGTLEGGHYTAVAQKPGRGWFYFDDANVSPVKEQAAVSKNAYVLFYTRRVDI